MTIPSPLEFGAPAKFSEWRPSQYDLFRDMTFSKRRYFVGNAPTGCHSAGTLVLRANGVPVPVESVTVGDKLLGPDGNPRTVLSLHSGNDDFVKVTPARGSGPFEVNAGHILHLVKTPEGRDFRKGRKGSIKRIGPDVLDISVAEYLQKSKTFKHCYKLVRAGMLEFCDAVQSELPLAPYFLGVYLGDGSSASRGAVDVTTLDPELRDTVYAYAAGAGMAVTVHHKTGTECKSYRLRNLNKGNRFNKNVLRENLRELGLCGKLSGEKFIPEVYKVSTAKNRLDLLAGILDTDGSLSGNCFDLCLRSKRLVEDVIYVARSLGLSASDPALRQIAGSDYWRTSISGHTDTIPVRLARKKAKSRSQKKNPRVSGFSIELLGVKDYYGFTLDKDNLYLTADFVIHHNSGKSPAYVLAAMGARDKGRRIAVITESKGLQKQLQEEFFSVGLYDMRGQNNYPCKALMPEGDYDWMWHKQWGEPTCDLGPCHAGIKCHLRDKGCDYFDSVKEALGARMVSTNYAYWIACNRFGEGLGKFDWLILDEAHAAHGQLVNALTVELTQKDFAELNSKPPKVDAGVLAWRVWSDENWKRATGKVEGMKINLPSVYSSKEMPDAQEVRFWKNLEGKLAMAAVMQDNWIIQEGEDGVITISPPWVSSFAEEYLFHSIPKIILVSATIVPKTTKLLGIDDSLMEFKSYPSSFPKERRPIIWIPTVKVLHESAYDNPATMKADRKAWAARIDQIISKRTDRKGIIHTVSFARQKYLMEHSKFKHLFIPTETKGTAKAVDKFKQSKQPAILLSPSVGTGYDFPYNTARYQIICKMPFPVRTDAVIQAQTVDDPDYPAYVCSQALVQMYGRPNRAADDFSETFVIDDNFKWFINMYSPYWYYELGARFKKRRKYDRISMFPEYFLEAISVSHSVPDAPKLVARGAN